MEYIESTNPSDYIKGTSLTDSIHIFIFAY